MALTRYNQRVSSAAIFPALKPGLNGYERFKVLTVQTGGAVSGALEGGERSASNSKESYGDRQCKSKPWCSRSSELEKRMIDKIIMVLKAIIVLLELIRMFF